MTPWMTILYTDIVKIIFVYYPLPFPSSCPHTIILPCPSQTTRKLHQTGWKTLMGQIYKITTLYPTQHPRFWKASPPPNYWDQPSFPHSLCMNQTITLFLWTLDAFILTQITRPTHIFSFWGGIRMHDPNDILPKFNKQHYHSDNVFLAALSQFERCHSQLVSCQSVGQTGSPHRSDHQRASQKLVARNPFRKMG